MGPEIAPYRSSQLERTADDVYLVDENEDGVDDYAFSMRDFSLRELRSNVVLRWKYRPGSTVFNRNRNRSRGLCCELLRLSLRR